MGTGECGGMGCIEWIIRGTVGGHWLMWRYGLYRVAMYRDSWWAQVNVDVWAVSSGYLEGQLVCTGECGGMGCIVWLCTGTFGGHR